MIEFRVLGTLALVRRDGTEARSLLSRPKQMALLAYLALRQPRGWQQRNSLLALFWPESDDRHARFSLRSALHGLRAELGADVILARGDDELSLDFELISCDALAFEGAVEGGQRERALDLYGGALLEGLVVTGLADFHIWADERREGLRRRAAAAAVALADDAESKGNTDDELRWTRRAIELSPHEEGLLRRQLHVLEQRGERGEAVRVYEQWVARLRSELDSEPSPETVAASERIRVRAMATPPSVRTAVGVQPAAYTPTPTAPKPATLEVAAPIDTPSIPAKPVARRVPVWRAVAVLGVAGISLALVLSLRRPPRIPAAPAGRGTAVLPFSFSGDSKYASLADAAAALLSAGLGDAGPLRAVDPQLVARFAAKQPAGIPQLALGAEAGRALGVSHFITGSIVEEQGVLRMQASLYAIGHEDAPLGRAMASGRADSVFVITDRLASDLLAARVGSISLDALGTTSVAALQAYVDGERQLFAARYAGAADAYSRAVAADSQFARAYFRLSYAAAMGAHDSLSRAAGARALALKRRLSPADRILLDAWLWSFDSRISESIFLYEKALSQDAHNADAWLQLAEIRYHWGPMLGIPASGAADAFRHMLGLVPDNGAALIHLARIEARDQPRGGGFDTLAAAARKLNLAPTEDLELRMLSAILSRRGRDRDSVLAEADARGAVTVRQLLATALPFADTTVAVALARDLARSQVNIAFRVTGQVELAQIAAAHGRVRDALRACDSLATIASDRAAELRAWIVALPFVHTEPVELNRIREALDRVPEVTPSIGPSASHIARPSIYPPRRLYLSGALALLAGDTARAAAIARDLADRRRPNIQDSAFAADYALSLGAELRMRTGPRNAWEAFPPAHTEADHTYPDLMSFFAARDRYLRAEALAAAGRTREAITWFETFPDPGGYDVWFLAPSLLRRAELYATLGRRDESRRAYERFIEFWQGADAELLPLVKRAREALSR